LGNESGDAGGGISANVLTVVESEISGNQAETFGGGVSGDNLLNIRNSQVTGNTAASGGGVSADSSTTITGSTISGNDATADGGGLFQSGGTLALHNSKVSGNDAEQEGGGLFLGNCRIDLQSSTVSGNSAAFGGGVYVFQDDPTLGALFFGSTISGNVSQTSGGGLFLAGVGGLLETSEIRNCTVSGNQAQEDGGGIMAVSLPLRAQNSTIAFNWAGTDGTGAGGGIRLLATDAVLQSTIVARNSAPTSADISSASLAELFQSEFSLFGNSVGGVIVDTIDDSNLFDIDPKLAPLAKNGGPTRTHALKTGSPALNKGSNPALLATDQRGGKFARIFGGFADIGAFERQ
jgi:hypothetical protein